MQPADSSDFPPTHASLNRRPSLLRLPWDWIAMAGGLLYWGIIGTLLTLIGGPLSLILPAKTGERLGRLVHHLVLKYFVVYLRTMDLVHADLSGLEGLRKIEGPIIVAPNHTSLWDVVFIIARMPDAVCVIKESILNNLFLGGGSRLSGYISNAGTSSMVRRASEALQRGGQLLLFPEGTRTHADARWVNPLKGGCALIASHAKVPVYPVFIRSNTRYLQKGWPLWRRPVFPVRMSLELGEPLLPVEGESAHELNERLQAVYEQELSRPHPLRRQIVA